MSKSNMEVIKTVSNLEFDVLYADGTFHHVKEGVLYEAAENGDLIFHNGTDNPAVLLAAAEGILIGLCGMRWGLEALVAGMVLSDEGEDALTSLMSIANRVMKINQAESEACFRLGQKDMQAAAVDALTDAAQSADLRIAASALFDAVELIQSLGVADG